MVQSPLDLSNKPKGIVIGESKFGCAISMRRLINHDWVLLCVGYFMSILLTKGGTTVEREAIWVDTTVYYWRQLIWGGKGLLQKTFHGRSEK
jgi:hypothetical protein